MSSLFHGWHEWAYPVPDDDFRTITDILMSLPDVGDIEFCWRKLPAFVVVVDDPRAAIYLRLAVRNGRPADENGDSSLDQNEVWVGEDERPSCERLLADNCRSPAKWLSFVVISFASDEAHRTFGAAYTAATGFPHRAPPPRSSIEGSTQI